MSALVWHDRDSLRPSISRIFEVVSMRPGVDTVFWI
jgi:hypothetical protein